MFPGLCNPLMICTCVSVYTPQRHVIPALCIVHSKATFQWFVSETFFIHFTLHWTRSALLTTDMSYRNFQNLWLAEHRNVCWHRLKTLKQWVPLASRAEQVLSVYAVHNTIELGTADVEIWITGRGSWLEWPWLGTSAHGRGQEHPNRMGHDDTAWYWTWAICIKTFLNEHNLN
jgi:hypothetical protein